MSYIEEILYKSTNEYIKAYQEGFDCAKHSILQELRSLVKKVENMEVFNDTSATFSINQTERE